MFVLDNSLRETTVASLYGHTVEGKYRVLEAVRAAGMRHLILGAFGPTCEDVDSNLTRLILLASTDAVTAVPCRVVYSTLLTAEC